MIIDEKYINYRGTQLAYKLLQELTPKQALEVIKKVTSIIEFKQRGLKLSALEGKPINEIIVEYSSRCDWEFYNSFNDYLFVWINKNTNTSVLAKTELHENNIEYIISAYKVDYIYSD